MQIVPLQYVPQGAFGKLALDEPGFDLNCYLVLAVPRMEMWRRVVAIIQGDHYPEETANLWHYFSSVRDTD